jgi:hypothetical protein
LSSLYHIAIKVEAYKSQYPLTHATTAKNLAMSGPIENNLPAACGVGAATCIETVRRRATQPQHRHATTAIYGRRDGTSCQLSRLQACKG